jgi:hypothetical protein
VVSAGPGGAGAGGDVGVGSGKYVEDWTKLSSLESSQMKNIQVIDGADNCAYSVFAATDKIFDEIFPGEGQDVEFVDDFFARVGKKRAAELLKPLWKLRLEKHRIRGIHGTLFYQLNHKKEFYPNKREDDFGKAPKGR